MRGAETLKMDRTDEGRKGRKRLYSARDLVKQVETGDRSAENVRLAKSTLLVARRSRQYDESEKQGMEHLLDGYEGIKLQVHHFARFFTSFSFSGDQKKNDRNSHVKRGNKRMKKDEAGTRDLGELGTWQPIPLESLSGWIFKFKKAGYRTLADGNNKQRYRSVYKSTSGQRFNTRLEVIKHLSGLWKQEDQDEFNQFMDKLLDEVKSEAGECGKVGWREGRLRKVTCKLCEKNITQRSLLRHNEVVHPGYLPFKCKKCDFAAKTGNILKRHDVTHRVGKHISCDRPGCGQFFVKESNLRRHQGVCKGIDSEGRQKIGAARGSATVSGTMTKVKPVAEPGAAENAERKKFPVKDSGKGPVGIVVLEEKGASGSPGSSGDPLLAVIKERNLPLVFNGITPSDGNCWFCAVADQIDLHGIIGKPRDHKSLREEVLDHLPQLPQAAVWLHNLFDDNEKSFRKFIAHHRKNGTWTDSRGIVSQATALYLGRHIDIVGTANRGHPYPYTRVEGGVGADNHPSLTIGYYQDKHYQSLKPAETDANPNKSSKRVGDGADVSDEDDVIDSEDVVLLDNEEMEITKPEVGKNVKRDTREVEEIDAVALSDIDIIHSNLMLQYSSECDSDVGEEAGVTEQDGEVQVIGISESVFSLELLKKSGSLPGPPAPLESVHPVTAPDAAAGNGGGQEELRRKDETHEELDMDLENIIKESLKEATTGDESMENEISGQGKERPGEERPEEGIIEGEEVQKKEKKRLSGTKRHREGEEEVRVKKKKKVKKVKKRANYLARGRVQELSKEDDRRELGENLEDAKKQKREEAEKAKEAELEKIRKIFFSTSEETEADVRVPQTSPLFKPLLPASSNSPSEASPMSALGKNQIIPGVEEADADGQEEASVKQGLLENEQPDQNGTGDGGLKSEHPEGGEFLVENAWSYKSGGGKNVVEGVKEEGMEDYEGLSFIGESLNGFSGVHGGERVGITRFVQGRSTVLRKPKNKGKDNGVRPSSDEMLLDESEPASDYASCELEESSGPSAPLDLPTSQRRLTNQVSVLSGGRNGNSRIERVEERKQSEKGQNEETRRIGVEKQEKRRQVQRGISSIEKRRDKAEKSLRTYLTDVGGSFGPEKILVLEDLVDELHGLVKTHGAGREEQSVNELVEVLADYLGLPNTRVLDFLVKRLAAAEKERILSEGVKREIIEID